MVKDAMVHLCIDSVIGVFKLRGRYGWMRVGWEMLSERR